MNERITVSGHEPASFTVKQRRETTSSVAVIGQTGDVDVVQEYEGRY